MWWNCLCSFLWEPVWSSSGMENQEGKSKYEKDADAEQPWKIYLTYHIKGLVEESWMPAPSYFHVKTPCFKSKNCNFQRTVWHCMLKYIHWPLCYVQLVSRGWTPSLQDCLCGTDSTRSSSILVRYVNVWVQDVPKVLHWFQIWWLWRPCEYTELIVVVIKTSNDELCDMMCYWKQSINTNSLNNWYKMGGSMLSCCSYQIPKTLIYKWCSKNRDSFDQWPFFQFPTI